MSTEDPADEAAKARRNKLISRVVIIAFGLLLAVYFIPLAWSAMHPPA